jgi:hypothetical protein
MCVSPLFCNVVCAYTYTIAVVSASAVIYEHLHWGPVCHPGCVIPSTRLLTDCSHLLLVSLMAAEGDSKAVEFSYSVKWKPTDVELEDRMDRYTQYSTKPQHLEVGWGCADQARQGGGGADRMWGVCGGCAKCRGGETQE